MWESFLYLQYAYIVQTQVLWLSKNLVAIPYYIVIAAAAAGRPLEFVVKEPTILHT